MGTWKRSQTTQEAKLRGTIRTERRERREAEALGGRREKGTQTNTHDLTKANIVVKCSQIKCTIFPSEFQWSRSRKAHEMKILKYLKCILILNVLCF